MIGKPEWFTRRKYGGWGLYPKKLQGWLYILAAAAPFILVQYADFLSEKMKLAVMIGWGVLIAADFFDIMINLKLDEREKMHEAIAERNALWAMMIVIAIAVAYQASVSIVKKSVQVDYFLIIIVLVGVAVKAISNIYLDKKD